MKKALYAILIILLTASCSDSNDVLNIDDPEKNKPDEKEKPLEEPLELSLATKSIEGNIFELMEFNIYSDKSFTLFDISEAYDSINWEVSGLEGRCKIFYKHSGEAGTGSHYTWKWSHNFFIPGEYETSLLCYKDDKVIHRKTVTVNITDKKDFLGYNWADIKGQTAPSNGYHDALINDSNFTTFEDLEQGVPALTLFLWNNSKDEEGFAAKSKMVLYNYINALYSIEPTYGLNNSQLSVKYDELFTNKKEYYSPLCIWLTSKAKIVLVADHDNPYYTEYKIYAEPNKQ